VDGGIEARGEAANSVDSLAPGTRAARRLARPLHGARAACGNHRSPHPTPVQQKKQPPSKPRAHSSHEERKVSARGAETRKLASLGMAPISVHSRLLRADISRMLSSMCTFASLLADSRALLAASPPLTSVAPNLEDLVERAHLGVQHRRKGGGRVRSGRAQLGREALTEPRKAAQGGGDAGIDAGARVRCFGGVKLGPVPSKTCTRVKPKQKESQRKACEPPWPAEQATALKPPVRSQIKLRTFSRRPRKVGTVSYPSLSW